MARKISVEIVGDSASLQRSFRQSGNAARTFDRDLNKSARGAVAASLSFHGLGRAVLSASGYFVAGGGIVLGLKAATNAAIEFQAEQKQLSAAVKAAGINYAANAEQINKNIKVQEDLGFTQDTSTKAYVLALRATKSVIGAQNLQGIAANVARGRNMDLVAATQLLVRVQAGQIGSLRRLGIEVKKDITGQQALAEVSKQYGGAAAAATGTAAVAQQRLTNAIHATEVTVGTALLPTITKLSTELSDWLNKSGNQARIQRDVTQAVTATTTVVKDLASGIREASDAVGGFKHLLELLIALKVASTVGGWAASLTRFRFASTAATGSSAALGTSLGNAGLAAQAGVASFAITTLALKVTGLDNTLKKAGASASDFSSKLNFGGVLPTGGGTSGPVVSQQQAARILTRSRNDFAKGMDLGGVVADITKQFPKLDAQQIGVLVTYAQKQTSQSGSAADAAAKANAGRGRAVPQVTAAAASIPAKANVPLDRLSQIQNAVAAARLAVAQGSPGAKTQLVSALKAEIDFDKKYAAIQLRLYKQGGKNAKEHAAAYQRLVADETSSFGEISSLTKKSAAAAKATSKVWADRLNQLKAAVVAASSTPGQADDIAALKAEIAAIQARIREHGKTGQLELQLANARKKLATAISKQGILTFQEPYALLLAQAKASATKSQADDVKVAREMKAFAEKMIKSGKLKGQALIDAWNEIAAENAVIAQDAGGQTHAVVASSAQLVAGIHFATTADKKAEEARIAQAQAHGGRLPNTLGVAGQPIVLHNEVVLDGQVVARSTTKHQQRAGSHAAVQTRGPTAGRNARVH